MTSNPPSQFWDLALKKLGYWPNEKPVEKIKKNIRHIQSLVLSDQKNQFKRKRLADGSSSSSNNYNMPNVGEWQKSNDDLLVSVETEEAILQSRIEELQQLKTMCKSVQSKIDQQRQQQREEEEEEQKAKEVEKQLADENTKKKTPVATTLVRNDVNAAVQQERQQNKLPQKRPNFVSIEIENDGEKISAADEHKYQPKVMPSNSSNSLVTYRGLYNQGLTCALNSVLQTLFMTPQFRQMIVREAPKAKPYYKTYKLARLYVELGKLFENLQYDEREFACSTVGFTNALGWTRRETCEQSDAHVVFRDILTAFQDSSSTHSKLINDIFHTELVDLTKCMECGDTMKQIQSVSSLAVPIQGHTSVEDCIRSFFNIDEIPGFACQKCDKVVTVQKRWRYNKMAPILAVNLMRFQQNGNGVVKLNDRLSFDTVLRLNSQDMYALYAIINHTGTVDGGHYYAYIREPPQDQWFEFNDAVVSRFADYANHSVQYIAGHRNYALYSNSAYILFYKKIGPIMASTDEGTPV